MGNESSAQALSYYTIFSFPKREWVRQRDVDRDRQTVNYEKQSLTKKIAIKSHERITLQKKAPEKSTFTLFFQIIEKKVFY